MVRLPMCIGVASPFPTRELGAANSASAKTVAACLAGEHNCGGAESQLGWYGGEGLLLRKMFSDNREPTCQQQRIRGRGHLVGLYLSVFIMGTQQEEERWCRNGVVDKKSRSLLTIPSTNKYVSKIRKGEGNTGRLAT